MTPQTRSLLIAVQLCFGIFPWLGKIAMQGFEPRAVLVWRLFVGAAVLMGLALFRHGRAVWPGGRDLAALFGLSLLGITINQLFFLEGLYRSTAVNAGLIMTVIPVATVGLGALLGHGRPGARQLVGIGLSVVGVAWLFLQRGAQIGSDSLLGDALMTINALSYSAYLVFARPLVLRLPQAVVIGWVFVFGALTAPWFSLGSDWVPGSASGTQWMALGGILLFPTVLAYLGNMISLKRAGANLTAAYVMLQPLVAALLGIGLLGERPEPSLAVTAVCVLAGLWFVSTPGRSKPTGPRTDSVTERPQSSDSSVSPT